MADEPLPKRKTKRRPPMDQSVPAQPPPASVLRKIAEALKKKQGGQ